MPIDLFAPAVTLDRQLHPQFISLRDSPGYAPARSVLKELQQQFVDPDGNFVEQFQTTGFDARTLELFLYAMFRENGYDIDRSHARPDFLLSKDGLTVGVEAVVAAAPANDGIKPYLAVGAPQSVDAIIQHLRHDLPVRLGSPLFSKLQKRYWELPHMAGRPFVIAIEDFHQAGALLSSSAALSHYLFGIQQHWYHDAEGRLIITSENVRTHKSHKEIPSGFFRQPGAEHVSGVLFCNTGTIAKFNRMGHQGQHHSDELRMMRYGFCYDHDPNAIAPIPFLYEVGDAEHGVETWREGTVLIRNPRALHPLPQHWLGAALEQEFANGQVVATIVEPFLPYSSMTSIVNSDIPPSALQKMADDIAARLQAEYESYKDAKSPFASP